MNDLSTEVSRHYVLFDRTTGQITQTGVNRASCVEVMAGSDLGILYDVHAMPHAHEVDVSGPQPFVRLKLEDDG